MNKEEKLNRIIELLDTHIRGAGDYDGVKNKTKGYLEKYIYSIINSGFSVI